MTIPLWAPVAALCVACLWPQRKPVDWGLALAWLAMVVSGVCFWLGVVWLVEAVA